MGVSARGSIHQFLIVRYPEGNVPQVAIGLIRSVSPLGGLAMGSATESYDYHLTQARHYFTNFDFEKAYLSAREATLLDLYRPEAWLMMARAAAGRFDWENEWKRRTDDVVCWEHCAWCYSEAIAHASTHQNSNLGLCYWEMGKHMTAFFKPHRDQSIKKQRYHEARALLNAAIALFREQRERHPGDPNLLIDQQFATLDLVTNHLELGGFPDAFKLMENMFRDIESGHEPEDARFRFYYAWTRMHYAIALHTDPTGFATAHITADSLTAPEDITALRSHISMSERDLERARERQSPMGLDYDDLASLIHEYSTIADKAEKYVWDTRRLRKILLFLAVGLIGGFVALDFLTSFPVAVLVVVLAVVGLSWPIVRHTRVPRWKHNRRRN